MESTILYFNWLSVVPMNNPLHNKICGRFSEHSRRLGVGPISGV